MQRAVGTELRGPGSSAVLGMNTRITNHVNRDVGKRIVLSVIGTRADCQYSGPDNVSRKRQILLFRCWKGSVRGCNEFS